VCAILPWLQIYIFRYYCFLQNKGYVPDILKLIGCSIVFFTSLVLFSFQKVKIHSGSFYKDRERAEPNRPKNPCELPLWTNKISE
jgi:hypothetical protein